MNEVEKRPEITAPDVTAEVEKGLNNYHTMRAERDKLVQTVEHMRYYIAGMESRVEELVNTNNRLLNETEHYKVLALQAKTHLHILQGHINGACKSLEGLKEEVSTTEKLSTPTAK